MRAVRMGLQAAHGATKAVRCAQACCPSRPPVRVEPTHEAHALGRVAFDSHGVDVRQLRAQAAGVVTPSAVVLLAHDLGREAAAPWWAHVAQRGPNVDGDWSTLHPTDFIVSGPRPGLLGVPGMREIANVVNSAPTAQQQSALNGALIIHGQRRPDSEFARAAAAVAGEVGGMWCDLPSRTLAVGCFGTAGATTGVVHLYDDVVRVMVARAVAFMAADGGAMTPERFLAGVRIVGGAGELAKQSALGALDSTQGFINDFGERVPLYGLSGLAPAKLFFTPRLLEAGVDVRDDKIGAAMLQEARRLKLDIKLAAIEDKFDEGRDKARGEGQQVQELAAEFAATLHAKTLQEFDRKA